MFEVQYQGETYVVAFTHVKRDVVMPKRRKQDSVTESRMVTTCVISRKHWSEKFSGLIEVARGEATCHPNDQFSRPKGRKLAFGRALWILSPERKIPAVDQEDGMPYREQDPWVVEMRHLFWYYFGAQEGWPWLEPEKVEKVA